MPRDTKTTPGRQRAVRGTVVAKQLLRHTARSLSAQSYLVKWLSAHPEEGAEASEAGVTRMGLEEAALARGWVPPDDG